MDELKNIQLTQTVQKGGCAAKVAATELRTILAQVRFPPTPKELIIGSGTFDDAAIYKINSDVAMVQTLDFFTPIVNTPRLFGRIAAANALSDVYAMGGRPATAMAILAFPLATMSNQVAVEVLQGASDVIKESKAALVGGHTIDDDTMKFGLSVTGFVNPEKIWSNAGAKIGDVLILTKALGTGTLTAALKRKEVGEDQIQDGLQSMSELNDIQNLLSPEDMESIHAATDVTGFGLAGHALNMARASGVNFDISLESLPVFSRTMEFLEKGFLTKAHRTNDEYVRAEMALQNNSKIFRQLICDPQTSGGLLLSVGSERAEKVLEKIKKQFSKSCVIGRVKVLEKELLKFQ